MVGHNYGTPSVKSQCFVTMLFFPHEMFTTKQEIMVHAMSLNSPVLLTAIYCVMPLLCNVCINQNLFR